MPHNTNNFSITQLVSILIFFVTICGGLWHLGYWSTFKFNYLEYANIGDIVKSTIYPFFKKFTGMLGMLLLSFCMFYIGNIPQKRNYGPQLSEEEQRRYSRRGLIILDFIIGILGTIAAFLIVAIPVSGRYKILPVLLGTCFSLLLLRHGFLQSKFKNEYLRTAFIFILVFYPSFSFFMAKIQSLETSIGLRYNQIISVTSSDSSVKSSLIKQRLLGTTENYLISLNDKHEITVTKKSSVEQILFKEVIDMSKIKEFNKK